METTMTTKKTLVVAICRRCGGCGRVARGVCYECKGSGRGAVINATEAANAHHVDVAARVQRLMASVEGSIAKALAAPVDGPDATRGYYVASAQQTVKAIEAQLARRDAAGFPVSESFANSVRAQIAAVFRAL